LRKMSKVFCDDIFLMRRFEPQKPSHLRSPNWVNDIMSGLFCVTVLPKCESWHTVCDWQSRFRKDPTQRKPLICSMETKKLRSAARSSSRGSRAP